jgi:hypothetical protein
MERCTSLIVDCEVTKAARTAKREAAPASIASGRSRKILVSRRVTIGAGKGFDAEDVVLSHEARHVTPHIPVNTPAYAPDKLRKTAVDGRTTWHDGCKLSQRLSKRFEESFGWANAIGGAAKLKLRRLATANGFSTFQMIAYDLLRIRELLAAAA